MRYEILSNLKDWFKSDGRNTITKFPQGIPSYNILASPSSSFLLSSISKKSSDMPELGSAEFHLVIDGI